MSRRHVLALLCLGVAGLSCDSGPKAGEIAFDYVTPANDDRAILFTVKASPMLVIDDVLADCAGCRVFTHTVSDTDWRVVLTGIPGNGPAVRVAVSDRKAVEELTLTISRVAGADYRIRSTLERRLVSR